MITSSVLSSLADPGNTGSVGAMWMEFFLASAPCALESARNVHRGSRAHFFQAPCRRLGTESICFSLQERTSFQDRNFKESINSKHICVCLQVSDQAKGKKNIYTYTHTYCDG
jgi:hypothetical protein